MHGYGNANVIQKCFGVILYHDKKMRSLDACKETDLLANATLHIILTLSFDALPLKFSGCTQCFIKPVILFHFQLQYSFFHQSSIFLC